MSHAPDLEDVVLAGAHTYGGPVFLDQVRREATAAAQDACSWNGAGDEPPQRLSV